MAGGNFVISSNLNPHTYYGRFVAFENSSCYAKVTTATGTVADLRGHLAFIDAPGGAGTGAGNGAALKGNDEGHLIFPGEDDPASINYDRTIKLMTPFLMNGLQAATGTCEFSFKAEGSGIGDPIDDKTIGFRVIGDDLYGLVHDGGSLATIDLTTTLSNLKVYTIVTHNHGGGKVSWTVNGTFAGVTNVGPTGTIGNRNAPWFMSTNQDGNTRKRIIFYVPSYEISYL